jgi:hypothetical protein
MTAELDRLRARVVDENLTGPAVAALTPVVRTLPLDALTPIKQLLKQFFSHDQWDSANDDELAHVVGPGDGSDRHELAPDLFLVWGWDSERFSLRLREAPEDPERA